MRSKWKYIVVLILLLIFGITSLVSNKTDEWLNFKTMNGGRISVRVAPELDLSRDYSIKVYYKADGDWFYKKSLESIMLRDLHGEKKISSEELSFDISENKLIISYYEDSGYITEISIDINSGECKETIIPSDG